MNPFNDMDIQKIREETQGTSHFIHFNNAGSSFPHDSVLETVIHYTRQEAITGGYEMEAQYAAPLEKVYDTLAKFIHAERDEIALAENASMAWSIAFHGMHFEKGDEIITSEMEYATSLLALIQARKELGVEIRVIMNDKEGNFPLTDLEKAINPKTKLIAVTQIGSGAAGVLPVQEIGKLAKKYGIPYLLDACQAAGQVPINVKEIGCDFLSITGRKYLRAPRGTGFLFAKKEFQDKIRVRFMDGHSVEWVTECNYQLREGARRFELYEKNRALVLGLGRAVEYAMEIGMDRIWNRVQYLASALRKELRNIPGVEVLDSGKTQCGIVTFSMEGFSSFDIKNFLNQHRILVSVSQQRSTLFYMNEKQKETLVRASIHYYNTEEEIKSFSQALYLLKETLTQSIKTGH